VKEHGRKRSGRKKNANEWDIKKTHRSECSERWDEFWTRMERKQKMGKGNLKREGVAPT